MIKDAKTLINENMNLTSRQIERQLLEQNKDNIMLVPKRSQIQNIVRNARQKEKLDDLNLMKNLGLKGSGDPFFQKYVFFSLFHFL